jgi:hypothetical protein
MPSIAFSTYKDLVDHVEDWLGANPSAEARRDARRAALQAYRNLGNEHRWTYYYARGRMNTVAPYVTGTIQYQHTGGAVSRLVTLTDGTWPDWAGNAYLVLGIVTYQVGALLSGTQLQLTEISNPGADVAAGTSYTLYRDTFPLPTDCLAIDRMMLVNYAWQLHYEKPGRWLERQRIYRGQATPRTYSIFGDPHYFGTLSVGFFPAPDNAYGLDFIYQRRPRPLLIEAYSAGTVVATVGSTSLVGSGTNWGCNMVGSSLRLSSDNVSLPTALWGSNPYAVERVVTAVTSPTALVVDEMMPATVGPVKYVISDPADIEDGAMSTALLRGCEFQAAMARHMKDRPEAASAYRDALILAREADSRNFSEAVAGQRAAYPFRLAYFPTGPDIS